MRLSAPELIAIILIILLLFGAKRLPDTARALGQSLKIFKKSVRDDEDEKRAGPAAGSPPQITSAAEPTQRAQPAQPTQPTQTPQPPQPAPADETKR
jgi:sec-independent protein translocase protein TatA